jgi:Ca-activated chloride channel family protein
MRFPAWLSALLVLLVLPLFLIRLASAQGDPLNQFHVNTPLLLATKAVAIVPLAPGASLRSGILYRIDTNPVLIPAIVADPMDRLVGGLEKQNFEVCEDNRPQAIRTFSCDDAPASIGIILDLSGCMSDKVVRARGAIPQFMQTSNPQDEFFVIGFNDRLFLISGFISGVNKVEADVADIATRISAEVRDEYIIAYSTNDARMDGKWRKVRVKLLPPPGLPPLTVHARSGYYAPLQ